MIEFLLAIIGALALFALGRLAASLKPDKLTVREREAELVPLVPSVIRNKHPDIWVK